jgi:hypothetical protein
LLKAHTLLFTQAQLLRQRGAGALARRRAARGSSRLEVGHG